MPQFKHTIPAEVGEKAQYLARNAYDNTIRFALFYRGQLMREVMKRAVIELVERIDILHASFTAGSCRARWVVNTQFCPEDAFSVQTAPDDWMEAVYTAMLQPIPFDGTLQLHCTIILNRENNSALVLRIGHMCADGSDAKYLLEKLIELYNCLLAQGDPASVSLKNGTRNPEQCCRRLTIGDRLRLYRKPAGGAKTEYAFPDDSAGVPRIVCISLPAELLTAARSKGKQMGASVNDLLLTAFYRAVAKQLALTQGTAMGIQSAMDLRRHVPGGDSLGVCNLSGSMCTGLTKGVWGSFADTLGEVTAQTVAIKEDKLAGMYNFPMMSQVFRLLPFAAVEALGAKVYGSATISMSNLGALRAERLTAGELPLADAVFGAHLKQKPAFQITAVGLNGAVKLCSVTSCTQKDEQAVRELYTGIKNELEIFGGKGAI